MTITASMVKDLRNRTAAGMMECKKALADVNGDMEAAVEVLRKKGAASADKKASRVAAEGIVVATFDDGKHTGALLEVNCETDFVAKDESFRWFAEQVVHHVLDTKPNDIDALMSSTFDTSTLEGARRELIAKIGENISVRRFFVYEGERIDGYVHGSRIGVLVELTGGSPGLGKDIAMHVAASKPLCVAEQDVPATLLEKEREIFRAQAEESGKPAAIIDKIVAGRVSKYLSENTLLGQPFVKNPDQTVGELLDSESASVKRFLRFEVGEGLEKRSEDFVAEVLAQAKGGR